MGMGYIKLPISFLSLFENLTYEQIGRLVEAMLVFQKTGDEPDYNKSDPIYYLWPSCRDNVLESNEAYERQCAANRANGKKGGRPPKQPAQQMDDDPLVWG